MERHRGRIPIFQPRHHCQETAEVAAQAPSKFSPQGGCNDMVMSSTPKGVCWTSVRWPGAQCGGCNREKAAQAPETVLVCSDFSNMLPLKCRKTCFPLGKSPLIVYTTCLAPTDVRCHSRRRAPEMSLLQTWFLRRKRTVCKPTVHNEVKNWKLVLL